MSTEPGASADTAAERARSNSIEDLECRDVAATPELLDELRHQVTGWAGRGGMAMDRVQDLVLAVYEAMANVAVHAYAGDLACSTCMPAIVAAGSPSRSPTRGAGVPRRCQACCTGGDCR
jgi:hypothetical protein